MAIYKLNYRDAQFEWTENELNARLRKIGYLRSKKIAWIKADLSTSRSTWLTRLLWAAVAQHFGWMRKCFYGVDHEMTRSLLKQIRQQCAGEQKILELWQKAVDNFNVIVPCHALHLEAEATLYELVEDQVGRTKILEAMKDSGLSSRRIAILLERIRKRPKDYLPLKVAAQAPSVAMDEETRATLQPQKAVREQIDHRIRLKSLVEGTITQFDRKFDGDGKLACPCINLKAVETLMHVSSLEVVSATLLDRLISEGVRLWKNSPLNGVVEYLEPDEVDLSGSSLKIAEKDGLYRGYCAKAEKGNLFMDFKKVLSEILKTHKVYPFAVVITRPPETVSVIVRSAKELWFFNSHGNPLKNRKAFVEKYDSLETLSATLHEKFPYCAMGCDMFFDHQFNTFQASVILQK